MTLDTSFPLILYIKSTPLSHLLFLENTSQVSAPLSISTACSWSKPPSFLTWTLQWPAFLSCHATYSPFCSQTGISGNANLTRSAQSLQPYLTFNDPMDSSPTRCISLAPGRLAAPPCCWRDRGLVTLATVTCAVWEHTWQWAVSVYKPSSRMERCLSAGLAQLPRSLCVPLR